MNTSSAPPTMADEILLLRAGRQKIIDGIKQVDGVIVGSGMAGAGAPIEARAAGGRASNIAQDGNGFASNTCLGEAPLFGRRANRHAATISA